MKKQVRENVFETNSSSSHSISVSNLGDMVIDTSLVPVDGKVKISGSGEYGWEWETFNQAEEKLRYMCQDGNVQLAEKAVQKQLGAELVYTHLGWSSDCWGGYIDHQSRGTTREIETVDEAVRFIFDKNSWLFTGNDNGEPPTNFYDTGYFVMTDQGVMKQEVSYKNKLVIGSDVIIHDFPYPYSGGSVQRALEEHFSYDSKPLRGYLVTHWNMTLNHKTNTIEVTPSETSNPETENEYLEFVKSVGHTRDSIPYQLKQEYFQTKKFTLTYKVIKNEDPI